jgi:hypothetical protein
MVKLGGDSQTTIHFMLASSLSLIPIVVMAQNLKKMALYIGGAVSPVPLCIFLLLSSVLIVGAVKSGTGKITFENIFVIIQATAMAAFMLISVTWQCLLGALVLRFIGKAFAKTNA